MKSDMSYDEWHAIYETSKDEFNRWRKSRRIHGEWRDPRDFWRLFRWWYWNVQVAGGED